MAARSSASFARAIPPVALDAFLPPLISLSRSAVRDVFALERDVGPDGSRHGAVLGRRRPITGLLTCERQASGDRPMLPMVRHGRLWLLPRLAGARTPGTSGGVLREVR